jgi:hypothetical protein
MTQEGLDTITRCTSASFLVINAYDKHPDAAEFGKYINRFVGHLSNNPPSDAYMVRGSDLSLAFLDFGTLLSTWGQPSTKDNREMFIAHMGAACVYMQIK